MTPNMLNTALPTIVPIPRSVWVTKVPMMLVKNSGDDVPAAMKVAPATSEDSWKMKANFEQLNFPARSNREKTANKSKNGKQKRLFM